MNNQLFVLIALIGLMLIGACVSASNPLSDDPETHKRLEQELLQVIMDHPSPFEPIKKAIKKVSDAEGMGKVKECALLLGRGTLAAAKIFKCLERFGK